MKRRLPASFYNPYTLGGAVLSVFTVGLILFLYMVEVFSKQEHPYMGLVTFVLLPIFFVLGVAISLGGIWHQHRRIQAGHTEEFRLPTVDLNNPRHRNAVALIAAGSFLFLVVSAFGSYQAYQYTDSVEFCGQVCHTVMKPEYVAYKNSPHARVACVECHIGPGATWFVKSKLSGSYQVYSVLFHKYPKPIATPIKNLRPAKETCEQCHWPNFFYAEKLQTKTYFLSDDGNSRMTLNMLMKIGGGNPEHGATAGIHYHMYINSHIWYIATDKERLNIPYIEARSPDGKVTVWQSTDNPLTPQQIAKGTKHLVDCIECHNRPSHQFQNPNAAVNQAMSLGWINPDLPGIKALAVQVLEKPYKTQAEGLRAIPAAVEDYYRKEHPEILSARQPDVDAAIRQIQRIYENNYFPEMGVSWRVHPDHIGHMYSTGCFRCHDGKHVTSDGRVLTRDCNVCHTILSQTMPNGKQTVSLNGVPFTHPVDIGDAWKTTNCSDCHAQQNSQ